MLKLQPHLTNSDRVIKTLSCSVFLFYLIYSIIYFFNFSKAGGGAEKSCSKATCELQKAFLYPYVQYVSCKSNAAPEQGLNTMKIRLKEISWDSKDFTRG